MQGGPSSGGSNDGGESGEEQDESSSSSENKIEDALTSFREKWQRELEISPKREAPDGSLSKQNSPKVTSENESTSIEIKAKNLFLKGIEHEQTGKLYEAIQFYKRAVQLVPDIEFRIYEATKIKGTRERIEAEEKIYEAQEPESSVVTNEIEEQEEFDDLMDESDLYARISKIVNRNQRVCFPKFEQNTTHISALPMEIILYILRWVVSKDLDFRSLEMFAHVCRGFYMSARDSEIWRLACIRVWGVNCGSIEPQYSSWREMYLLRPRLRYNGCYMSKTTYIRPGENSFQDHCYRPWHLVEYFRYLRFFPEGRALMLTSTDDAQSCVNSLKSRTPRNLSVLVGHYRLHKNRVTLVLRKQETKGSNAAVKRKKKEVIDDSGEQHYHIELEIQSQHKRANFVLVWMCYNIFTKYRNGQEATTRLALGGPFPSFKFNRVKSYTLESEAPL